MPLIPQKDFIGLDDVVHLSCGGESPMLRSHHHAIDKFTADKALGERARSLQLDTIASTRDQCASLFSVDAEDITFLSSASEGINIVAYGLPWQSGDNIVIADVEFASGVYPWLMLEKLGVEIRIVRHKKWHIELDDIAREVDDRTRVVHISQVSMFTGQRLQIPALADIAHSHNAALILDATHAAGVVPVDAHHADVMMTSCYKWLLGVHGTAIFYWNRKRLPELNVPFLGWNSVASAGGWKNPTQYELRDDAHRFIPGNPAFLSIYILNNALEHILALGIDQIEAHALTLTERLWQGINEQGWEIMTPYASERRAGNVCIMSDRVDEIASALRKRNVLVWGTYAGDSRLRISTHVYNNTEDVDICLDALSTVHT